jgi:hypothetical protein
VDPGPAGVGTTILVIATERHPTNSSPRAPALTAYCSATQASTATVAGGLAVHRSVSRVRVGERSRACINRSLLSL